MEMNINRRGLSGHGAGPANATSAGTPSFRPGPRLLFALVVCCGGIAWAGCGAGQTPDAMASAVHAMRSGNPSERVRAIRDLAQLGMVDTGRSIPLVIEALKNGDSPLREQAA